MVINFNQKKLTADEIISLIPEQSIYEFYLRQEVRKEKFVKCCFHKDHTPSLGFYRTARGNLMYKCFGCGAQGNVFSFISRLFNCDYKGAVDKIREDFNLNSADVVKSLPKIELQPIDAEIKTQIIPTYRKFTKVDSDYWNSYGLELTDLLRAGIQPCQRVYIVNRAGEYILFAEHSDANPIYCFDIGGGAYKIYRPLNPSKKGKWLTNATAFDLQGMNILADSGNLLIITSSLKDVLVLNKLGYNAIAPGGEGMRIPEKLLDYLYAKFDNIVIFYDNDKAGIEYAKTTSEQVGCGYVFIPTEYSDTKDISDYARKYSLEEAGNLMKRLI